MKNAILKILILIGLCSVITFNSVSLLLEKNNQATNVSSVDISSLYSTHDVKDIEKQIKSISDQRKQEAEEEKLAAERLSSYENLMNQLDNGVITYRQLFSDTYIVGDSLMHGLNMYRILDSSKMITMVSASLYHLDDNIGNIIASNPERLVLHYGINNLINSESGLNSFITMYERILKNLKASLPDTEIYVSSIFSVSVSVAYQFPWIDRYNSALFELTSELGVNFVDNSECLPADGSYYGSDGIHVTKDFYTQVWLPHLFYSINMNQEKS